MPGKGVREWGCITPASSRYCIVRLVGCSKCTPNCTRFGTKMASHSLFWRPVPHKIPPSVSTLSARRINLHESVAMPLYDDARQRPGRGGSSDRYHSRKTQQYTLTAGLDNQPQCPQSQRHVCAREWAGTGAFVHSYGVRDGYCTIRVAILGCTEGTRQNH